MHGFVSSMILSNSHRLTPLQILKLYAWEPSYKKKIIEIREQELEVQKSAGYLAVFSMLTLTCIPFLVSVCNISCFDFQICRFTSKLPGIKVSKVKSSISEINFSRKTVIDLCRLDNGSFKEGENMCILIGLYFLHIIKFYFFVNFSQIKHVLSVLKQCNFHFRVSFSL